MPLVRRSFRFDATLYLLVWNHKVLLLSLLFISMLIPLCLIETFQSFTQLAVFSIIIPHYFLSFTGSLNLGTLLTQASHLFFLYLSLGILLLFVVLAI